MTHMDLGLQERVVAMCGARQDIGRARVAAFAKVVGGIHPTDVDGKRRAARERGVMANAIDQGGEVAGPVHRAGAAANPGI
jgi:hypothetical protein